MLALTLWRPWPWAFTHADKRVENRTWAPPRKLIGECIALHAGKHFDRDGLNHMLDGSFGDAARAVPRGDSEHQSGVIVAVARLEDVYDVGYVRNPSPWEFGPVVWSVPDVIALPHPVACKGAQGLWRLPPDVDTAVRAQVSVWLK